MSYTISNITMPQNNEWGIVQINDFNNTYFRFEIKDGNPVLDTSFFADNVENDREKHKDLHKDSELYIGIQKLLDDYIKKNVQQNEKLFLVGVSFSDYRPGMKLHLHEDHEGLKTGDIVTIKEVSGFDEETKTYKRFYGKDERYFIVENDIRIIWNKTSVSCYIERDATTLFLEKMFDNYEDVADKRKNDSDYGWNQDDYDHFLENKHETLLELVLEYEYSRLNK